MLTVGGCAALVPPTIIISKLLNRGLENDVAQLKNDVSKLQNDVSQWSTDLFMGQLLLGGLIIGGFTFMAM